MNNTFRMAKLCAAISAFVPVLVYAQGQTAADLIEMDFEQLVNMEIEVESAGKNKARGLDVPYAAYVISAEDIRLSGARNIPEALRMAPGVTVDQIGAHEWSVAIRGGGGQFSRFVLVLVNGKSLYTSVFSGVNWEEVNYSLADIKQIEVIRGPNAAAWGANAVNGIINIITYSAEEKKEGQIEVWAGDHSKQGVSLRQSGDLNAEWDYSANGYFALTDGLENADADLHEGDGYDWRISSQLQRSTGSNNLQIFADVFGAKIAPIWSNIYMNPPRREPVIKTEEKLGFGLQANYESQINEAWSWTLRSSIDATDRDSQFYYWNSKSVQADIELSGDVGRHSFNAGINSRFMSSEIVLTLRDESEYFFHFVDDNENIASYGAFLSDTIQLGEDWQLSLSARLDHNELSGSNFQPSTRLMWQMTENQRLWLASSRAASTPSRAIVDTRDSPYDIIPANTVGNPLPIVVVISELEGDENVVADALEVGYRFSVGKTYFDITGFKNTYTGQITLNLEDDVSFYPELPNYPIALIQRGVFSGSDEFESTGFELNAGSQLSDKWTVQGSFSKLEIQNNTGWENAGSLRSIYSISNNLTFSTWLIYRTDFESIFTEIEDVAMADLALHYEYSDSTTMSFQAKNLGSNTIQATREAFFVEGLYMEPHGMLTITHKF